MWMEKPSSKDLARGQHLATLHNATTADGKTAFESECKHSGLGPSRRRIVPYVLRESMRLSAWSTRRRCEIASWRKDQRWDGCARAIIASYVKRFSARQQLTLPSERSGFLFRSECCVACRSSRRTNTSSRADLLFLPFLLLASESSGLFWTSCLLFGCASSSSSALLLAFWTLDSRPRATRRTLNSQ